MTDSVSKILIPENTIRERLDELADEITKDFEGKNLTVITLLTGGLFFTADLLRKVPLPLKLNCIQVSSYHGQKQSSGQVSLAQINLPDIKDREVLILDDILDTGQTLHEIYNKVQAAGARKIKICVLLEKRKPRTKPIEADYIGFEIEDEFVVGYGLDYQEQFRNLPYIGVL